jgi:1,5-anhydro-D-fructose reductase (1,5-anhydro-D-mannitol-forming)
LGWGIAGASASAAQLVQAIRGQPPLPSPAGRAPITSARAVGIFSHSEHRARLFADAHAVPHPFVNLADLLAHPDIHCVYVGNHPRHHAQTALAALAAGKHVLCEPPLALELDEAQTVAHTALDRGLVLAVNFRRRADPALRALRELIADGTVGDLLGGRAGNTAFLRPPLQTWRLRAHGGGVLLDRTAHTVDVLRYLLRDEVAAIHSQATTQLLGDVVEEDVLSTVTFRRSTLVFQLHDSFLIPHAPTTLEIYGSSGTLVARHCFVDEPASELVLLRHSQTLPVPLIQTDPWRDTVQMFLNAIRTQAAPLATGADGVLSLASALAAQESLRRGYRMALPSRPLVDRSLP